MDIEITKEGFKPNNVVAEPPEFVVWHNKDDEPHTVTAADGHSFDSASIPPGGIYEFNFRKKGIYAYYDKYKPQLQGEISISNIPPAD